MFTLFKDPKIDFMGRRNLWVGISLTAMVLSAVIIAMKGVNLGIEFTGGTEIQAKYVSIPDLGAIRAELSKAGLGNNIVTTIGKPADNEVYIRLGIQEAGKEADLTKAILQALRSIGTPADVSGKLDLNTANAIDLQALFETSPDITREDAEILGEGIAKQRKESSILRSPEDLAGIDKMSPAAMDLLRSKTYAGSFAIRSQSYIGPTIGGELLRKAAWAIVGSLAGMLAYIAFRFHFRWGVAAVIALIHDTFVTLGLFALFGKEMSLPVVAAFLTLIGYSVNDTVVIFDRIRENMKMKGGNLETLINDSVNQTLSRTILTSGLTWLVVLSLFLFAGEPLNAFSFVLTVGIIVGSYSTIYIASPILVMWANFFDRKKGSKPSAAPPAAGGKGSGAKKARKVRSATSVG